MYRVCIAVVDATRARLLTLERNAESQTTREELREHKDLVNPGRRRPGELFSDTRPGASRAGSHQNPFDDHRSGYVEQLDAEFARLVITELQHLLDAATAQRLIVCASPRMLGELRAIGVPHRDGMVVDEVPRDLSEKSTTDIRDQLASYGLLPPRPPRPSLARGM